MTLWSIVTGYLVDKYLKSENKVAIHQIKTDGKPETILSGFAPGLEINVADGENIVFQKMKGSSSFKVAIGGTNQKIEPVTERGERRLYSVSEDGSEIKAIVYLKNDGTLILNEGTDSAVLFSELKTAYDQLKSDFDNFVSTVYGVHTHIVTTPDTINGTASPTTQQGSPSTGDIAPAESEDVKLS